LLLFQIDIMKIIFLLLLITVCFCGHAQKLPFVRVYDLAGKKINKGHVRGVTDTTLLFKAGSMRVQDIGSIETKHSVGNNVLIGSLVGMTTFAIIGAGYAEADGAAAGAAGGLVWGALIGGLTGAFKNSKKYFINGDTTNWKTFQLEMIRRNRKN
jgi:hypothetical protein